MSYFAVMMGEGSSLSPCEIQGFFYYVVIGPFLAWACSGGSISQTTSYCAGNSERSRQADVACERGFIPY